MILLCKVHRPKFGKVEGWTGAIGAQTRISRILLAPAVNFAWAESILAGTVWPMAFKLDQTDFPST